MTSLHWVDYIIFTGFLLISLGIGLYHAFSGGRQRTTKEFIMADRKLKVLPTMLSLLVSFQSALMILGFSAEIYMYGTQQWFSSILGYIIGIAFAERFLVAWLFPLKIVSVFEYLEMRYHSKLVRIFGAALGALNGLFYIGPAMFAPSLALEAATGFPTLVSIPIMAVVATAYTALGGMKAVIWTDVFQALIMICGLLAVLIKGCVVVGGLAEAFEYASDAGRIVGIDFSPDPRVRLSFWSVTIGFTVNWASVYGVSQASVQRFSGTRCLKDARLSLLFNIPSVLLLVCLAFTVAIVVSAYFVKIQCDPMLSGEITSANQILPYLVKVIFAENKGFSGLFLATLYSGALSLSGCAANFWEDILKERFPNISEIRAAFVNKMLVICFGVLGALVAFLASILPGPVTQVAFAFWGAIGGPLFGLFLLGGTSRSANWKGALLGSILSMAFTMWIVAGASTIPGFTPRLPAYPVEGCLGNGTEFIASINSTSFNMTQISSPTFTGIDNVYAMSFLWYGPIGTVLSIVLGQLISCFFNYTERRKFHVPKEKTQLPDYLFIPWRAITGLNQVPGRADSINKEEWRLKKNGYTEDAVIMEAADSFETRKIEDNNENEDMMPQPLNKCEVSPS